MPSGRPATLNSKRKKADLAARLATRKCDPVMGMVSIALGELICNVCRGKLKSKYKLPTGAHTVDCAKGLNRAVKDKREPICACGGIGERLCESCYGTGYEIVSPELRGKMYAELAGYLHAKLKAIEHSGEVGMVDLAAILRERYEKHTK